MFSSASGTSAKRLHHLVAAGEMMLGRQPPPVVAGDEPSLGDGQQRVVRLEILRMRKERLVGGDERQVEG